MRNHHILICLAYAVSAHRHKVSIYVTMRAHQPISVNSSPYAQEPSSIQPAQAQAPATSQFGAKAAEWGTSSSHRAAQDATDVVMRHPLKAKDQSATTIGARAQSGGSKVT